MKETEKYADDPVFQTLVEVVSELNREEGLTVISELIALGRNLGYTVFSGPSSGPIRLRTHFAVENLDNSQFIVDYGLDKVFKHPEGRTWVCQYFNSDGDSFGSQDFISTKRHREGLDLVVEQAPSAIYL